MKNISVDLDALTLHRKKSGLSISRVSEAIGYKTPTGYWLIEKGERKLNVQILYRLASLYSVPMEELLKITD